MSNGAKQFSPVTTNESSSLTTKFILFWLFEECLCDDTGLNEGMLLCVHKARASYAAM